MQKTIKQRRNNITYKRKTIKKNKRTTTKTKLGFQKYLFNKKKKK